MTDPNRSVADELEEVEQRADVLWREMGRCGCGICQMNIRSIEQRAAALRSDFALLAYAGRKP